jgi:hypothetical protein
MSLPVCPVRPLGLSRNEQLASQFATILHTSTEASLKHKPAIERQYLQRADRIANIYIARVILREGGALQRLRISDS